MTESTLERVAVLIGTEFSCPPETIAAETRADEVDGWDSLAHARLIMRMEDAFGLRFPGERLFDLDCVGDLVSLVDDCLGERKS